MSFQLGVGLLAFIATLIGGLVVMIVRLWSSGRRRLPPPLAVATPATAQDSWHSDTVAFLLSGQSDRISAPTPSQPAAHSAPWPARGTVPNATVDEAIASLQFDDEETVPGRPPLADGQRPTVRLEISYIEKLLFQSIADD